MHFPLRVGHVGGDLVESILLGLTLFHEFLLLALLLVEFRVGDVPVVEGLLTLGEGQFGGTDDADVFV